MREPLDKAYGDSGHGRKQAFDDGYQYMIQREDGRVILGGMRWITPTKATPS